MKHALPAHLTRARWLAETLPPAKIICATTHAALDVLLYRQPATIETVADPQRRILALFDALRGDPDSFAHPVKGHARLHDPFHPDANIASYILERATPEPTTIRFGIRPIIPTNTRLDLLARRLLAMQFDTDRCAAMIRRYDTPDALLVVLHPPAHRIKAIAAAMDGCTGQVAIATTLRVTYP